ncbi:hypothetical protein HY969_02480 [Candidatus Kaiserbacteria bacterium]|nr:hypothetical protein [Candidatus Kaiserbacteria bacterium]
MPESESTPPIGGTLRLQTITSDRSTDVHTELTAENFESRLTKTIQRAKEMESGHERRAKAEIASVLERGYYVFGKNAAQYREMITEILERTGLPETIDSQDQLVTLPHGRQPGLAESINATLERYEFIENLSVAFGNRVKCIVVGGSMSYGPFFNVRSGDDASDIDVVMVVDDSFLDREPWNSLVNDRMLRPSDKHEFLARMEDFRSLLEKGQAEVLSQRFWDSREHFNMSAHFFTPEAFGRVYGDDLYEVMRKTSDIDAYVADYRSSAFARDKCAFYGFGGDINSNDVIQTRVENGCITQMPSYRIINGRYYPGLYQCLLLPEPLLVHAKDEATAQVMRQFSSHMQQRAKDERVFNEHAHYLNAYPRRMIFPPGRYQRSF